MLHFGMPWRTSGVMDETHAVCDGSRTRRTFDQRLCRIYGVARETGYVWLRRYREAGVEGLRDQRRAPERHPNQTPEAIEQAVLAFRRAHMKWGPRKLKDSLQKQQPRRRWPAASTIGAMIAREGLVIRAQAASAGAALHAAVRRGRRAQPALVCRFQGLVPHRRWRAYRSADHLRRAQPIPVALPGGGEDQHRARAGDLRSCVSRAWDAGSDPHRQRGALRLAGPVRAVAAVGVVEKAGHSAGAHPGWTSGAERTSRAHAPHPEAGDGDAAGAPWPCPAARL